MPDDYTMGGSREEQSIRLEGARTATRRSRDEGAKIRNRSGGAGLLGVLLAMPVGPRGVAGGLPSRAEYAAPGCWSCCRLPPQSRTYRYSGCGLLEIPKLGAVRCVGGKPRDRRLAGPTAQSRSMPSHTLSRGWMVAPVLLARCAMFPLHQVIPPSGPSMCETGGKKGRKEGSIASVCVLRRAVSLFIYTLYIISLLSSPILPSLPKQP